MAEDFNFGVYNTSDKDIQVNAIIKDNTIRLMQKSIMDLLGGQTLAVSEILYKENKIND